MSWQEVAIILGSIFAGLFVIWGLVVVTLFVRTDRKMDRDFEQFRGPMPLRHNWHTTDRQRPKRVVGRRIRD